MAYDQLTEFVELDHQQDRIQRLGYLLANVPTSFAHAAYIQGTKASEEQNLARTRAYLNEIMPLSPPNANARPALSRLTDVDDDELLQELFQRTVIKRSQKQQPQQPTRPQTPGGASPFTPAPAVGACILLPVPIAMPGNSLQLNNELMSFFAGNASFSNVPLLPSSEATPEAPQGCTPRVSDEPLRKWARIFVPTRKWVSVKVIVDHDSSINVVPGTEIASSGLTPAPAARESYTDSWGKKLDGSRTVELTWTGCGRKTNRSVFYVIPGARDWVVGKAILQEHGEGVFQDKDPTEVDPDTSSTKQGTRRHAYETDSTPVAPKAPRPSFPANRATRRNNRAWG